MNLRIATPLHGPPISSAPVAILKRQIPFRKPLALAILGFLYVGDFAPSVAAITLTVTNTNDGGAGSLRQAISSAGLTGDVIIFDAAVTGTITLTSGQLSIINKELTITGPGAANLTISGNNTFRVFGITNGTVAISGLRIADGFATGNPNANNGGGGIYNNNGKLTLQNCEISNNVQFGGGPTGSGFPANGQGGGIWHIAAAGAGGGRMLLQSCLLSGNMAIGGTGDDFVGPNGPGGDAGRAQGGALFIFPSSANSVTLQDCTFVNNSAVGGTGGSGMGTGARGRGGQGQGGAVFVEQNTLLVAQRCTFTNNNATGGVRGAGGNTPTFNPADGQGGAIHVVGFAVINNSTLDSNKATGGPGIVGTPLIGALGQGGGLFYAFGATNMTGNTLINNSANGGAGGNGGGAENAGQGGGIYQRFNSGVLNLSNCTVTNNVAQGGNASALASGGGVWTEFTLNVTNCTIAFNVGSGAGAGGGLLVTGGTTTLANSLLAKNLANSGPADATGAVNGSSSYNFIGAAVGLAGISNGTNHNQIGSAAVPLDPLMQSPSFNGGPTMTCALNAGSPAINAGNDATAPLVDQRGYVRADTSDIGAFEFGGIAFSLQILSITRGSSGPTVLSARGAPNSVHRIQISDDLGASNFVNFATTTSDAGGLIHYEDATAGLAKRFYRIVFP